MADDGLNLSLILTGVILSFLTTFLPHLLKPIINFFNKKSDSCYELRKEVSAIKLQLSKISVVDEFAKHARLQRKLNSLQNELKDQVKSQMINSMKVRLLIIYSLQILLGLTSIVVFWHYRTTPVVIFPSQWLYPIGYILSWPTSVPGALSFGVWLVTTNVTCKMALEYCK